ncbi:MAG: hypothetical protein R3B13_39015 [Polyangiaceae bacterium]
MTFDRERSSPLIVVDAVLQRLDETEREQQRIRDALTRAEEERRQRRRKRATSTTKSRNLERCRKLERGSSGRKTERLPDNEQQPTLAILQTALGKAGRRRSLRDRGQGLHATKRPRSKAAPEHLPRVDIEILPVEVQQRGLDAFERIGQEVMRPWSDDLHRSSRSDHQTEVRAEDRAQDDETTAVFVERLPHFRSRAVSPALMLADTIVRRWQDHQLLNRLEGIYERDGFPLARSIFQAGTTS